MTRTRWTIVDILKTTTEYFTQKAIENPRLNAEMLLAHLLGMRRVQLYLEYDRPLSDDELNRYRGFVSRRAKMEPLQYITGAAAFMGMDFKVTSAVLIPRPETELLVEKTLALQERVKEPEILDMGTGSGIIAISLARMYPGARLTGIDISAEALKTAQENAETLLAPGDIPPRWILRDINSPWPEEGNFDIIVSNPPYIHAEEMDRLPAEVRNHEPRQALTDEADGLRFYDRIFNMLSARELTCRHLLLEMSGSQAEKIISMSRSFNFSSYTIYKDLNQIDRVLHIQP